MEERKRSLKTYLTSASEGQIDSEEKTEHLENLLIAELKWTLFCSALDSYKRDFLLDPFPPNFYLNKNVNTTASECEKNFDELVKVTTSIGNLKSVKIDHLSDEETALLHWVLMEQKIYDIKVIPNQKYADLKRLTQQQCKVADPDFIFEIAYRDKYPSNVNQQFPLLGESTAKRWPFNAENRNLFYAYHGSRLANFYNIIHNGLKSKLNKTSAFGEGTYLSSELNVSLNWSPFSSPGSAKCSFLGEKMGCVALCEIVDDERRVKHGSVQTQTAVHSGSQVPERYFIVQDDSAVRVKYLLLYSQASRKKIAQSPSRLASFLVEHKFLLMIVAYGFLLLLAAFATSGHSVASIFRRWTFSSDQFSFADEEF